MLVKNGGPLLVKNDTVIQAESGSGSESVSESMAATWAAATRWPRSEYVELEIDSDADSDSAPERRTAETQRWLRASGRDEPLWWNTSSGQAASLSQMQTPGGRVNAGRPPALRSVALSKKGWAGRSPLQRHPHSEQSQLK